MFFFLNNNNNLGVRDKKKKKGKSYFVGKIDAQLLQCPEMAPDRPGL